MASTQQLWGQLVLLLLLLPSRRGCGRGRYSRRRVHQRVQGLVAAADHLPRLVRAASLQVDSIDRRCCQGAGCGRSDRQALFPYRWHCSHTASQPRPKTFSLGPSKSYLPLRCAYPISLPAHPLLHLDPALRFAPLTSSPWQLLSKCARISHSSDTFASDCCDSCRCIGRMRVDELVERGPTHGANPDIKATNRRWLTAGSDTTLDEPSGSERMGPGTAVCCTGESACSCTSSPRLLATYTGCPRHLLLPPSLPLLMRRGAHGLPSTDNTSQMTETEGYTWIPHCISGLGTIP